MEKVVKKHQKVLARYLNGEPVVKTLQTPSKDLSGCATPTRALFCAAKRASRKASAFVALVALQKGWKYSQFNDGDYLVCILSSP